MNTARLSPLIKAQPKLFVDAKGVQQDYVVVYKDEGGKHTYHHTMRVSVPATTQTVSVAAYAQCSDPACAQHSEVLRAPRFVSDQFFYVRECCRSGYKGPLPPASAPVHAWRDKANVWSYKTFMDEELVIKCNFLKVTSKCVCGACGGETHFKIAVVTDGNCVDTSLPVCVMSKRKIPASMRKKSQREIKAFMEKARNKKARQQKKRKGVTDSRPIQIPLAKKVKLATPKRGVYTTESIVHAMTFDERLRFIEIQDTSIKNMTLEIEGLQAELAKKEQLLAAFQGQEASKSQKVDAVRHDDACITPCTNYLNVDATPPTFSFLSPNDCVPVEPFSLYDDGTTGNLSDIGELQDLDLTEWDLA